MPQYNAADEGQVKERKLEAKFDTKRKREVLRTFLSTPDGRLFFHEFLSSCHIYHAVAGKDPYLTYFADGERNVGLRLQAELLAADPRLYFLMLQEAMEKQDGRRTDEDRGSEAGDGAVV